MSDFIRIFCRSAEAVTASEIAEFVCEGVYFDETPRFDPPQSLTAVSPESWQKLAVYYQAGKRPILFHKSAGDSLMQAEIEEIISEEPLSQQTTVSVALRQHLLRCAQTLTIEINSASLTEEAWEMLDSVEAYFARKYQGIIYVAGEGFYDEALQLVV